MSFRWCVGLLFCVLFFFFFFNDTATTEIYTLSLHDALPIYHRPVRRPRGAVVAGDIQRPRSEEHTSELQSPLNLVCRLLLEKKKNERTIGSDKRRSETGTLDLLDGVSV